MNNTMATKAIKPIEAYSNDELKKLYKSYTLYLITEYICKEKKRKKDNSINGISALNIEGEHYSHPDDVRFFNLVRIRNIENKLNTERYKDENEEQALRIEKTVLSECNEVLFWYAGGIEKLEEDYDAGKQVMDPNELYESLHEQDDFDIEYGRATKEEIYTFIWETLRYCNVETLKKLTKLADKKFEIKKAHRPSNNKKIYKYDKENNLIETFENRLDCIEKEGISKSSLSNVLSGTRKTLNGYIYIEED